MVSLIRGAGIVNSPSRSGTSRRSRCQCRPGLEGALASPRRPVMAQQRALRPRRPKGGASGTPRTIDRLAGATSGLVLLASRRRRCTLIGESGRCQVRNRSERRSSMSDSRQRMPGSHVDGVVRARSTDLVLCCRASLCTIKP